MHVCHREQEAGSDLAAGMQVICEQTGVTLNFLTSPLKMECELDSLFLYQTPYHIACLHLPDGTLIFDKREIRMHVVNFYNALYRVVDCSGG